MILVTILTRRFFTRKVYQVKSAGGTLGPRKFFNLINLLTPLVLPLVLSPPRRFPIKTRRNFIRELERKTPCQSSSPSHAEVGKEQTRITPWTACVSVCVFVCIAARVFDGSMLSACREIASSNVPLLGINLGRLGFLTDISPDEIVDRVKPVLEGEFKQSKRFMLSTTVTREGVEIGSETALNDVVLHPGMSVRMMAFELYVDGEFVYSQRSDGLIVATPTGSTAYALSAGGPLLFPELDAMVVVPLNPHTLSSRPIALHGSAKIEIRVSSRNELHPLVTCDGHNDLRTEPGDIISIEKYPGAISLIHPKDHNFYSVCRSKLGWGSRLGVKKSRPKS